MSEETNNAYTFRNGPVDGVVLDFVKPPTEIYYSDAGIEKPNGDEVHGTFTWDGPRPTFARFKYVLDAKKREFVLAT